MIQYLCASGAVINYNLTAQPERIINAEDNRIRGFRDYKDNDFVLGGLFAVHTRSCKDLGTSGPEEIEAFLYAIDLINDDLNLLPNIKLGYDIRDTCGSETVALDESNDMIISHGLVDGNKCSLNFLQVILMTPVFRYQHSLVLQQIMSQLQLQVYSDFLLYSTSQLFSIFTHLE